MPMTIKFKKSPTADTRTCDVSKVSSEQLLESSRSHIDDVQSVMRVFADMCCEAGTLHDITKITQHAWFYRDFKTGFKVQEWYEMHKRAERHHIGVGGVVPTDVNLIDVLEHIADCVAAGMARSGSVYDIEISDEVLQQAVKNTVEKVKAMVVIVEEGTSHDSESDV